MTSTIALVISIVVGVIAIITAIIKSFKWAVRKVQLNYKQFLDCSEFEKNLKSAIEQLQANNAGTRAILQFRLRREMMRAIEAGSTSILQFNDTTKMFEAYKALGGNGTIAHLYEDYHELPVSERK